MPQLHLASVQPNAPRANDGGIVVAEFFLNAHQSFRAEIIARDGHHVVSLSRWKRTANGPRSTGQAFEFGAHRLDAVAGLLADVQRVLATLDKGGAR